MGDPLPTSEPARAEKRTDAWLWIGLLLGPFAMGLNTMGGYTVAHWTTDIAQKKLLFLISALDLGLCFFAFVISSSIHREFQHADEDTPIDGRRRFMATLAMLLSVLSGLLVIAGTLAVITLHSTD